MCVCTIRNISIQIFTEKRQLYKNICVTWLKILLHKSNTFTSRSPGLTLNYSCPDKKTEKQQQQQHQMPVKQVSPTKCSNKSQQNSVNAEHQIISPQAAGKLTVHFRLHSAAVTSSQGLWRVLTTAVYSQRTARSYEASENNDLAP